MKFSAINIRRSAHGIAAIEMAIVLPLVLLLVLPIGELGRAYYQYSRLSHRVQAAARHVAENALSGTTGVPGVSASLRLQAQNIVIYGTPVAGSAAAVPGLAPDGVQVTVSPGGLVSVGLVTPYPYQSLVGGLLPALGFGTDIDTTSIRLRPTAVMRVL